MNVPTVPMMNPPEVEAVRKVLADPAIERVLEWGAGGSTVYWPKAFPRLEWWSVEHNREWYTAVKAALPTNANLILLPFPDYWKLDLATFDLIIVDGRERVRCLDAARAYLRPGGKVLLHDFSRSRYKPGIALYKTARTLVPPLPVRDHRGTILLSDPYPSVDPAPAQPGTAGAMYLVWGKPASEQAAASIRSLRTFLPDFPVVILGDETAKAAFAGVPGVAVIDPGVNPFSGEHMFGFKAGRVKPLLARYSPFERTMYVDADTEFKRSPAPGLDLLDKWDFVIAEAETRSLALTFPDNQTEAGETAARLGTDQLLYHNSGLFFWRANPATARLFRLWGEEWMRYQGWDEQIALLRALLVSEVIWLNVPYTWNCRGPQEAWMVYHRFASQSARKFGRAIVVVPNPRGAPMPPSRPLVRLEVAPGRFVQVQKGNEAKALAHFQALNRTGRKAPKGG